MKLEDILFLLENILAVELTPGHWLALGYQPWAVVAITGGINAVRFILEITVYWTGFNLTRLIAKAIKWCLVKSGLWEYVELIADRLVVVRRQDDVLDVTVPVLPRFEIIVHLKQMGQRVQENGARVRQAIVRSVEARGYLALFIAGIFPYVAGLGALVISLRLTRRNWLTRRRFLVNNYLCLVAGSVVRMVILTIWPLT